MTWPWPQLETSEETTGSHQPRNAPQDSLEKTISTASASSLRNSDVTQTTLEPSVVENCRGIEFPWDSWQLMTETFSSDHFEADSSVSEFNPVLFN